MEDGDLIQNMKINYRKKLNYILNTNELNVMKKLILIPLLLLTIHSFSQETVEKKKSHEVKLNAFNTLIFKSLEGSYEYLINKESSVGISIMVNLNDEYYEGGQYNEEFALTPFYRRYFSRKYAWGFFMEAFGMYNKQQNNYYEYDYVDPVDGSYSYNTIDEETNNFALGIALGGKFVSQKGFAFEFFGGVGRNLFTSDSRYNYEFVPRLGVSFGYRF